MATKKATKKAAKTVAFDKTDFKALKKAYLSNTLENFINSEMGKGKNLNTDEMIKYLETIEVERKEKIMSMANFMSTTDKAPSITDEGKAVEDEEKIKIHKSIKEAEKWLAHYAAIAGRANERAVQDELQKIGHALTALEIDIKRYRYLMYQKYMRKMFELWGEEIRLGSRKEAEDFAATTEEYYKFKSAYALETSATDVIVNCRKEFAKFN